jgi:hypothetical protein
MHCQISTIIAIVVVIRDGLNGRKNKPWSYPALAIMLNRDTLTTAHVGWFGEMASVSAICTCAGMILIGGYTGINAGWLGIIDICGSKQ